MKSKFLKLYNLIMESVSDFDIIKNKCYDTLNELEQMYESDKTIFDKGMAQLAKDNKSIDNCRVICSGKDIIKCVGKKQTTGSGHYKMKLSQIKVNNALSNDYFNAIFWILHNQKINAAEKNIAFEIYTPSNAGEKEQKEESQIEAFKNELKSGDPDGVLIQDPNNEVRGPFNNLKKTEGNKLKSDATLYNDDNKTDDKLYISLKASDGKPVKPGAFNQYGGKNDLGGNDDKILETSPFINNCYQKIVNLFDFLKITDYNFQTFKKYLENYNKANNTKLKPIFAFKVPEETEDNCYLNKTKFGSEFGEIKEGSPKNVDLLIDGDLKIENDKLKGTTHTEWNPSLYNDKEHKNDANYELVLCFAPQLNPGKFGKFKNVRFNTFPANSNRVKPYIGTTKELFEHFGI